MKLLLSKLAVVQELLLRRASAGTWFALAALLLVAAWGWCDPFGLRQRLDLIVTDQFLQHRNPAEFRSSELLQISIDDRAAGQLGITDRRHRLARAIRQLQLLGARAVLVDVLYLDPGSQNPFDQEEAIHDGVPPDAALPSEIKSRYVEDQLLAESLASLDRVVLPFHFDPGASLPSRDEPIVQRMSEQIQDQPGLDARILAKRLELSEDLVQRLYEDSLRRAVAEVAKKPEAAAARLQSEPPHSRFGELLRSAMDRLETMKKMRETDSFDSEAKKGLFSVSDIQVPLSYFATHSSLGFAEAELSSELEREVAGDEVLRRLPFVALWQDRCVVHQGVAVLAQYLGTATQHLTLDSRRRLHIDDEHIVRLDYRGRLVINWPTNGRRNWVDVIPQISLVELIELARYDADIRLVRHHRRLKIGALDKEAAINQGGHQNYATILKAYSDGEFADAVRYERTFDEKVIPAVLDQPKVRDALEKAKKFSGEQGQTGSQPGEQSGDRLVSLARDILDIDRDLPLLERERDDAIQALRARIQGKLCLVGETATGSTDFKITPVGKMPGVSVIASAINTALTTNYLTVCGYSSSVLLMSVLAGGLLVPLLQLRALPAGACSLAGLGVAWSACYFLLVWANMLISPVTTVAGLLATYLTTATYQWLNEYRQKKLVRTIFEAQTNPTIVERLIEAGQAGVEEVLAPKHRQVTVFFAELADFEGLARQVAPERLPEIMSRVFGAMAKVILANEGTLDRYQGHAMVAFFGAPVYQPDHSQRACRAALECCDVLRGMAGYWQQKGLPVPRVHVGLHTGELLVGNITLTSRVDYTVAGENLNVAYRIGELNEVYGTEVMISEATLTRCDNMAEARELDLVRIKGRREPVRAYELMSAKGRLSTEQLQLRGTFATGLIAFRNRDYASALSMFRTCRETAPGDRPATIYIERCEQEIQHTVAETGNKTESA